MAKVDENQLSTADDLEELARRVKEWVNSREGTTQLVEVRKSVQEIVDAAEKADHINSELLRKPVTL